MADPVDTERHNVNLSSQVWGELKFRAFQEKTTASELIVAVVKDFLKQHSAQLRLTRYQPRRSEPRLGRSVHFHKEVRDAVQEIATQAKVFISGLIEHQLKVYLGLASVEESGPESLEDKINANPGRYVRMGDEAIDLGENPIGIDWKTGKPQESG